MLILVVLEKPQPQHSQPFFYLGIYRFPFDILKINSCGALL